jgi:uncharacterized alkaline shock family protein YloU
MVDKDKSSKKVQIAEQLNPSGIRGALTLNEDVVATIARLSAKQIGGIYSVGKTPLISLGGGATRGVAAEVGKTQAAFDLDIVVEYGHDIRSIAKDLREKTAQEVKRMAGRDVVEINIHVVDIKLPEEVENKRSKSRVM